MSQQEIAAKLEELGYVIHKEADDIDGILRQKDDTTKGLVWKGQQNYDEVGDLIYEYIQEEMRTTYGLKEVWFPENADLEEDYHHLPRCNIFMSSDFTEPIEGTTDQKNALVLIQGTGAVRAG